MSLLYYICGVIKKMRTTSERSEWATETRDGFSVCFKLITHNIAISNVSLISEIIWNKQNGTEKCNKISNLIHTVYLTKLNQLFLY